MAKLPEFRNVNALWGAVFARTLRSLGVTHAVVSPGSRSTPLAYALAGEAGLRVVPVLDERTAGFFALGIAKVSHRPVILLCTSGTAVANYLPAIVEARHSRTPLIVVTADRPPELRDCGAGQTIDQHKIFGGFVAWEAESALPESSPAILSHWRQLLVTAWEKSSAQSSPVHLNVPLREPLAPAVAQKGFAVPRAWDLDAFCRMPAIRSDRLKAEKSGADANGKIVIVAGAANPENPGRYCDAVRALADALDAPVLADALNPFRHRDAGAIWAYDAILRDAGTARKLKPGTVVQLGPLPTSKVLRECLAAWNVPTVLCSEGGEVLDPNHTACRTISKTITDYDFSGAAPAPAVFSAIWENAQKNVAGKLNFACGDSDLFEANAVKILAKHLPADAVIFFANSMPVRDAEYFWPAVKTARNVFSNRGANGIDGTLGTALGVAEAAGKPCVLLTGDLSFLHDSNALLLAPEFSGSLTVVLVNNAGGGIFNHLPSASENPFFEKFWATPQCVDFAKLAGAHAVPFFSVKSWSAFIKKIKKLPARGLRVLEIKTDRAGDAARRKMILASTRAG